MNIFAYALIANYGSSFLIGLGLLVLLYLALRLIDHGRAVVYRAGIDWLELRARYDSQNLDRQKQRLALEMPKQNLLEWANWYVAHQNDIEIEVLADVNGKETK